MCIDVQYKSIIAEREKKKKRYSGHAALFLI